MPSTTLQSDLHQEHKAVGHGTPSARNTSDWLLLATLLLGDSLMFAPYVNN